MTTMALPIKSLRLLGILALTVALGACNVINTANAVTGSGNVITETRNVSDFDSISVSGSGDLIITQGETEGLTLEGEDNLLKLLKTEVKDGNLDIRPQDNTSFQPTKPLIYRVSVRNLNAITLSGSVNVQSANLNVPELTVTASGSNSAALTGRADAQTVTFSGSGKYNGEQFAGKTATLNFSGSAEAVVNVSDTLNIKVSGSARVEYLGEPKVTEDVSGSADIRKR